MSFNKHNYLGEHRGKANILLTATIEDEFSITLKDEQDEVKSSWEMTMHKEDAEKVIRKAAEMLGVIPIYDCRSCKNNGNERYCLDCHDYCNFVRYEARPQGKWKIVDGYDGDEYYECSNCGEPWVLYAGTPEENNMNFCPNCGADMRKG